MGDGRGFFSVVRGNDVLGLIGCEYRGLADYGVGRMVAVLQKRIRNKRTKIRFPVFENFTVTVIVAKNLVNTARACGAECSVNDGALFVEHPKMSLRCWLLFERGSVTNRWVVHEASHAIRHMFKVLGVRNDDETFAYHLGHLTDKLNKFLKDEIK